MTTVNSITQHAVDRYMERSGTKSPTRAMRKLFELAEQAIPIGHSRFYASGWIVVMKRGVLKTCYKPRTLSQTNSIFAAHAKAR